MLGIMFDFFQPEPNPNRQRYDLMLKRRQALLEFAKLRQVIKEHPRWHRTIADNPSLVEVLEQQIFCLDQLLCQRFCQADSETLQIDIQNIYVHLVKLSKLWWALEQKQSVDALMERQFSV